MTEPPQTDAFPNQLQALFDAPSPGLRAPALEAQILRRIVRRRRLRASILAVGALAGTGIAVLSLSVAQLPSFPASLFTDLLTGKFLNPFLPVSLGESGVASLVIASGMVFLALVFARILEEV